MDGKARLYLACIPDDSVSWCWIFCSSSALLRRLSAMRFYKLRLKKGPRAPLASQMHPAETKTVRWVLVAIYDPVCQAQRDGVRRTCLTCLLPRASTCSVCAIAVAKIRIPTFRWRSCLTSRAHSIRTRRVQFLSTHRPIHGVPIHSLRGNSN